MTFRAYWVFNLLGVMGAFIVFWRRARQEGLLPGTLADALLISFPFGLIGGRVLSLATEGQGWVQGAPLLLSLGGWQTGYVSFGSIVGVAAALALTARIHQVPFSVLADLASLCIFVTAAFGRIGCFLNRCCYGWPTSAPWMPSIHATVPGSGAVVARHPVQLYEAAAYLLLLVWTLFLSKRAPFLPGRTRLFFFGIAGYSAVRLTMDILRDPLTSPPIGLGLSLTQWIAGAAFLPAIALLLTTGRAFRTSRLPLSGMGP